MPLIKPSERAIEPEAIRATLCFFPARIVHVITLDLLYVSQQANLAMSSVAKEGRSVRSLSLCGD